MTLKRILLALALCLPLLAVAQDWNAPKYLKGACPLNEQGALIFHADYDVPGKSRAEIYQALKQYVETSVLKGENALKQCHIVEADEADGLLAARMEEYLYFKKNNWVTHRTRFFYELVYDIHDGGFSVEMRRMIYLYEEQETPNGEPQRYTAEEWISDKEALKKNGNLVRKTRKFRVFTIDRRDELFAGSAQAAGAKQ
ncbi:MAG: DUF4468 domain-containing protein [Alloprevotella sp.]|nr:DUF4468 domain-containing protein [Alloprevotella sp.]